MEGQDEGHVIEMQTALPGMNELERTPSGWAVMKKYLQSEKLRWYADPLQHGYYSVKVPYANQAHHEHLASMSLKVKVMPWDGTRRYVVAK